MKKRSNITASDFVVGSVFATCLTANHDSVSTYVVVARDEEHKCVDLLTIGSSGSARRSGEIVEAPFSTLLDDVRYITKRLL